MHGKNAEIGEEVLGLRMLSKNGQPMVGFPAHVKDEYSAKLREAGYTVLIEQAFELNPPKREAEKLQTLQQVVDKFFGTDCESAETERGNWQSLTAIRSVSCSMMAIPSAVSITVGTKWRLSLTVS